MSIPPRQAKVCRGGIPAQLDSSFSGRGGTKLREALFSSHKILPDRRGRGGGPRSSGKAAIEKRRTGDEEMSGK